MKYDLCELEKIIIRSKQMTTSTYFVILKHDKATFSTGILIDSPIEEGRGWHLFAQEKFKTELAAIMAFIKMSESSPIEGLIVSD